MYQEIKINYNEMSKKRKELKSMGYISSVAIATKIRNKEIILVKYETTIFRRLKELVKLPKSEFHAFHLNISCSLKWWYKESELIPMLKEIGAIK